MQKGGPIDSASKGHGVVAVAVDSDKNSQYALRWAGDNLLARGQIFYLLHIRRKITSIPTHRIIFFLFHLYFLLISLIDLCFNFSWYNYCT
jgi:hypothetical protein